MRQIECFGYNTYCINISIFLSSSLSIHHYYSQIQKMNIYISNLSYSLNDNDLKTLFEEYGEVTSAKIIMDHMTGRSRGFGFVEMPDKDAATKAIRELHEAEYDGKVITVNEAKPREDRPKSNFGGGDRGGSRGGNGGGFNSDRKPKRW